MGDIVLVAGITESFVTGLIGATVTASTPLILAALGEVVAERAGMLNLGVEGIMLLSALFSFMMALTTGSLFLGFLTGVVVGIIAGLLRAFLTVSLKRIK